MFCGLSLSRVKYQSIEIEEMWAGSKQRGLRVKRVTKRKAASAGHLVDHLAASGGPWRSMIVVGSLVSGYAIRTALLMALLRHSFPQLLGEFKNRPQLLGELKN